MNPGGEESNHANHKCGGAGERRSSGLSTLSEKQPAVEVMRASRSDGTCTYNGAVCVMTRASLARVEFHRVTLSSICETWL